LVKVPAQLALQAGIIFNYQEYGFCGCGFAHAFTLILVQWEGNGNGGALAWFARNVQCAAQLTDVFT
jgi:hypothetical protein